MLTRIAGVRRLRSHFHVYGASHFRREDAPHAAPVALLAPLHPKDLTRFAASHRALRQRLAHPISELVVVSPDPDAVAEAARAAADGGPLTLLSDADALPDAVAARDFVATDGRSRRGWLRQQFIKLSAPELTGAEHVLTMDADTKPAGRLRFIDDAGRSILYTADEYSPDYFENIQRLLGPMQRAPWSFVAHCMLFRRDILLALRAHVSDRAGAPWAAAMADSINPSVSECFSEYELYGNFAWRWRRDAVTSRYFLNAKTSEARFLEDAPPPQLRRFRMISSHLK